MPFLSVVEFGGPGAAVGQVVQTGKEPPVAVQKIDYTGGVQTVALNANSELIRLVSDANCYIRFDGTASTGTDSEFLPSGAIDWRAKKGALSVSVISA